VGRAREIDEASTGMVAARFDKDGFGVRIPEGAIQISRVTCKCGTKIRRRHVGEGGTQKIDAADDHVDDTARPCSGTLAACRYHIYESTVKNSQVADWSNQLVCKYWELPVFGALARVFLQLDSGDQP